MYYQVPIPNTQPAQAIQGAPLQFPGTESIAPGFNQGLQHGVHLLRSTIPAQFTHANSALFTATVPAAHQLNPGLVTAPGMVHPSFMGTSTSQLPQGGMGVTLVTAPPPVQGSYLGAQPAQPAQFTNPNTQLVSAVNPPVTASGPNAVQHGCTVNTSMDHGISNTAALTEHNIQSINEKPPAPKTPERATHVITLVSSPHVSPHITQLKTPVKQSTTFAKNTENTCTSSSSQVKILSSPIVVHKSQEISQMESRITSLESNIEKLVTLLTTQKESVEHQTAQKKQDSPQKQIEAVQNTVNDDGRAYIYAEKHQTPQKKHPTPPNQMQSDRNTGNDVDGPSSPEMFSDAGDSAHFEDVQPEVDKILQSKALQQDSWDTNAGDTSFPSLLGSVKSYDNFKETLHSSSSVNAASKKRKRPGRPKNRS